MKLQFHLFIFIIILFLSFLFVDSTFSLWGQQRSNSLPLYFPVLKKIKNVKVSASLLLFKDRPSCYFFLFVLFLVDLDCNRTEEQVEPFLGPSCSHCYFKKSRHMLDFKGMMKAQCWIVQKEAPVSGRGWERGMMGKGKKEKSCFETTLTFSSTCFFFILCICFFLYLLLLF